MCKLRICRLYPRQCFKWFDSSGSPHSNFHSCGCHKKSKFALRRAPDLSAYHCWGSRRKMAKFETLLQIGMADREHRCLKLINFWLVKSDFFQLVMNMSQILIFWRLSWLYSLYVWPGDLVNHKQFSSEHATSNKDEEESYISSSFPPQKL